MLVAPSVDWLSTIVARAWLPDELIVICERTFASRVADIYRRLSSHPDLSGSGRLGERLACVAEAAKTEVEARGVASVNLDLEPQTEMNFTETLVDLTGDDPDEGTEIVILTLASGRKLQARPSSVIIRYNQDAEINPFERACARDIRLRDIVVVPDQNFIEEAREILPVRVLAQSWVEVYHSIVEAQIPHIPGNTLNAQARKVLSDIQAHGARTQSQAAVLDWLKVAEHKLLPPEQRQPHAPQRRREFDAFMSVFGVHEAIADKMWMEGIHPLRIDRRRAGHRMAQAFVSVLVDPHGTASGLSNTVREGIGMLRKKALDYVDQVIEMETIDTGEDHE